MTNINLKKFDFKKELRAQRELFKQCFPENIGTSGLSDEHYQWKFHSKKGIIESAEYVAYSDSDMVGYYAGIPYRYSLQDTVLTAAMVCDVMTGIKARGKGVFTKLGIYSTAQFAGMGFDFTTGYPIREEVIPGHLKAGWNKYFELPLFGRFLKFDSFFKSRGIGLIAPFVNVIFSAYAKILDILFLPWFRNLSTNTTTNSHIGEISGLVEFFTQWQAETPIALIKDHNFLKWRLSAPGKSYHVIVLRSHSNVVGVLIAREVEREGVPCMGILELALLKSHYKYSSLLIKKLVKIAENSGAELLLVMMSNFWFKNYKLRLNGFTRTPFKFCLIMKILNPTIKTEIFKEEKNWHLMWIDSDDL